VKRCHGGAEEEMGIEEEVGALLKARSLTLATAESCTGGLLGHRITNVPGSSEFFLGGFVTYADELKEALLGVGRETLEVHGAVSEETAREMARGARQRTGADLALAITGIAGPDGGTEDKPVGLTYIALAARDTEACQRHVWPGELGGRKDRLANKERSAKAALQLLLIHLGAHGSAAGRNPEFVGESVTVEGMPAAKGRVRPLAFIWRGRRFPIESWGRESLQVRDGNAVYCYLVQTAGPETWELCQNTETAQWTLTRHWAGRPRVV
jgi:PncC family amidohydrolase